MATAARRIALQILRDASRGGEMLSDRLARPDVEGLDSRDRAFLHELTLGALRMRGALDHAIAARADRPLERIDPAALDVLRLGAYQILRTRVPARAAVSESVELAGAVAPRARGFVNAVLRRLAREGAPSAPDPDRDPIGWLTTAGSLPRWLAERWTKRLGPTAARARAVALLGPPPVVFRLNPRRPEAEGHLLAAGVACRPLVVPGALELVDGPLADLAARGFVYVQDQGSQMVAHLAGRTSGPTLDACAAPGGKSALLADLDPDARVIAAEISRPRLRTLATLLKRWGAANVRVVGADARRLPFRAPFATVLLDAPCSGLGTLGRHPDIRWRARPEDLERHALRQRELLESTSERVAPGGTLVFATCSIEPEENEGVVTPFLETHPEFQLAPLPEWAEAFRDGPFARTAPERDRGDGFFAARLVRDRLPGRPARAEPVRAGQIHR